MSIQRFHSNLVVTDYYLYPDPPIKGKGWFITFEDGLSSTVITTHFEDKIYPAKEIVINASSLERAQYVADMIFASLCLHQGMLPLFDRPHIVTAFADLSEEAKKQSQGRLRPGTASQGDLPLACLTAAKASFKREYQYALFKYLLSQETLPTNIIDLDPSHWQPGPSVSFSAEYHIRCAYAIVLAYSVLEELSLEVRASPKKPSTIEGKWNPVVKKELEVRLLKAGIDLSETISWDIRDTPTRIERTRPPRAQSKSGWAYGKIRDSEVDVIDAIAYASWLRGKVSAHKLQELAQSLSYYNVSNVQGLARRLLLEKLGVWRYEPQWPD